MQIEIGPGDTRIGDDWVTVNAIDTAVTDRVCEWGEMPLPFEDGTASLVDASHVLEHVPWFKTVAALQDVHRVLQRGGTLEVWVPDFAYLVACYRQGKCGDGWRYANPEGDPMVWLNGRVFTRGPEPNWHRSLFDERYLTQCLHKAGFKTVVRNEGKPRGYDHGQINLGVIATK
jgi:ubiquinone/menaquinone biosynthesis C-methylase UbiE